jgi:hypothetical protein
LRHVRSSEFLNELSRFLPFFFSFTPHPKGRIFITAGRNHSTTPPLEKQAGLVRIKRDKKDKRCRVQGTR